MTDPATPRHPRLDLFTETARDALTVRRVFGDPIIQGDLTIVPVAQVSGGSGLGFGSGSLDARRRATDTPEHEADAPAPGGAEGGGTGDGGGGGFGVSVRALGVFVIRGDDVVWQPAVDMTRVILGGQVVGALAILALARALRRRRR